jgi:DNA-binding response OmpR family regulator
VTGAAPEMIERRQAGGAGAEPAPMRMMIVDDNVDAAESLAALLRFEGHDVIVMEDAVSTIARAAHVRPQVFILDIGLPDMDGYQLVRQLRAQPEMGDAVYIALTGYGQAHDKVLARSAGFDHHFVKPVDWQELSAVLSASPR